MAKKALVVDDSQVDLANIKGILTAAGYVVVTANNGKEGIAKAKLERPSIIFMDIVMPDMDGYEACRTLSQDPDTKDINVIFVSSKGQKADQVWGRMQGGKGHIVKPATSEKVGDYLKATA